MTLNYYVPHKILSGVPFKLGVTATNNGKGWARNLQIDSGKIEITTNQAGLLTEFEIIGGSWGSSASPGTFKLSLGDIPHEGKTMETESGTVELANSVSGYWLVRWKMYESGEGAKPYEGEFRKFTASLSHKTYEGVELDSLIVGVTTEIIGRDELLPDPVTDETLSLINEGYTGFPNYL